MRILVLGGTSFVGRAIVDDALRAGAEVTLFTRGRTGTGVSRRIGDREIGDYAALREGSCGQPPLCHELSPAQEMRLLASAGNG